MNTRYDLCLTFKLKRALLQGIAFVGIMSGGAGAAAQIDTSILKQGNTWVYEYTTGNYNSNSFPRYSTEGTRIFRLDSLKVFGDTTKFWVNMSDTGTASETYTINPSNPDPNDVTRLTSSSQTTAYTFIHGAYSPSTPFFAINQTFSHIVDSVNEGPWQANTIKVEKRVAVDEDTLAYKTYAEFYSCRYASSANLQSIGSTQQSSSLACGHTRESWSYVLASFNGKPFGSDSLIPVSIHRPMVANRKAVPRLSQGKNKVLFEKNGVIYDGRGIKIPESAIKR